jgi:hypothetical protein
MTTTPQQMRSLTGRGWAYAGAILGGLTSIAANVAHSYVPPQGSPVGWQPQPGAVLAAVVWPVFLLVAVELLARVPWPDGINWQLLRWAGMVPVAAVAALVSYRHLSGLLAFYREEPLVCVLGPLAVDGLMVMATAAILATSPSQHTTSTTASPSTTEAPSRTVKASPRTTEAEPRTITFQSVPAAPDAPSRDRPAPTMPIPADGRWHGW